MADAAGNHLTPQARRGTQTRTCLLLAAMCAAMFLPALGSMPLVDPDESRCAMIVQDMLRTGQWLMPHLEGEIYWDKPAPFFWAAAIVQKLTGSVELGGRLVAAMSGLAVVLMLSTLTRRIAGQLAGLLAGVILATSLMFIQLARWYRMDMPLSACILAALWWYWRYESPPRRADAARWVGFYFFCALAVLLKGPAGVVLPVAVIAVWLLLTRQTRRWREFVNFWGILVFIVIAAPWYLAVAWRYPNYFNQFFLQQNVARFASTSFGGHQLFGIGYVLVLLGGMLPWSLYFFSAFQCIWPRRRGTGRKVRARYNRLSIASRRSKAGLWFAAVRPLALCRRIVTRKAMRFDRGRLFLSMAVLVPLILFSLSRTQMPVYILPILAPTAALLALPLARWVSRLDADRHIRRANVGMMITLAVLAAAFGGIEIYFGWVDAWWGVMVAGVIAAIVMMVVARRKGSPALFLSAATAGLAVVLGFGVAHVQPRGYEVMSLRSLARAIGPSGRSSPGIRLCAWGEIRHSLTLYCDAPWTVRMEPWPGGMDLLTKFLLQSDSYCCWSDPHDLAPLERLAAEHSMAVETLARKRQYRLIHLVAMPAAQAATATTATALSPACAVGWRGDGTGVFAADNPPTEWDEDRKTNILWSVKVGAGAYGSPIVVGERVFLLSDPDKLVCLNAATGRIIWERPNGPDQLPDVTGEIIAHGEAGNTTPTPCSDGKFVYAYFGTGIVACYDLEGNRKWIVHLPEDCGDYGRVASPVLVGGKLIVLAGVMKALDPATGKTLWKCDKVVEEYGTPPAWRVGSTDVVLPPTGQVVRVSDGAVLSEGLAKNLYASPAPLGDAVYYLDVTSIAARLPGKAADAIELKKLWSEDLDGDFYSSGVAYDGAAYAVNDQGMLFAVDAATGRSLWKQQLDIPNASGRPGRPPGHLFPSLAVAGKHLYVSNDQGDTLVLEPGKEYKEIGRGKLNEGSGANLFFAGGRIYARGGEFLYCIGRK